MTPEEIRAEAIERIARADYEFWTSAWGKVAGSEPQAPAYDDVPESGHSPAEHYRRAAIAEGTRAVDALGDLIPTGIDTRTIVHDPDPEDTMYVALRSNGVMGEYADVAERWRDEGGRVVNQRRWTHDWQEVPDA